MSSLVLHNLVLHNVRLTFILPFIFWSLWWGGVSASYAQSTSSTNSTNAPENRTDIQYALHAKPLECTELINQLEARLLQSPNNKPLIRAFERAILLCQAPLNTQIDKNSTATTPQSVTNAALTFGFGYHSNPEFVADYDQIDLNFNGISLRLMNTQKAKPAATQRLGLVLTHKPHTYQDTSRQKRQDEYQLNVSLQRFDRVNDPNRLSIGLRYGAFFQQKALSVSYQHTQDDLDNNAYGLMQLEGIWAHNNGALNRLRLGRTFYTNAPVLEGTLIEVQHFFSKIQLSEQTRVQPIIGLGGNIEVIERAGGNQWLWQIALGAITTKKQHELGYGLRLGLTQDIEEYSAILKKNTKRSLLNLNSYLKWRYLGLDTLTPDLTLSYVKQESNIELFNWQFWKIELSAQIKW